MNNVKGGHDVTYVVLMLVKHCAQYIVYPLAVILEMIADTLSFVIEMKLYWLLVILRIVL